MPRILLCSATAFEIQPVLDDLAAFDGQVSVCLTGVGLLETAFSLSEALAAGRPDYLVQAGIAGCLEAARPLGSAVVVGRDMVGDQGVEEGGQFRSTFGLGFGDPHRAPWSDGWLSNPAPLAARFGLPVVDAVSVNEISTSPARIAHYRSLGAVAESMEGAAFHYAALRHGIPFVQLRAFSNYIGERDKTRWQLVHSIENLNRELRLLLQKIIAS